MDIRWLPQTEFWRCAPTSAASSAPPDGWFLLGLDLPDIRARIPSVVPAFTPAEEGDFAGPVERWYGTVGPRFILTFHYALPTEHASVVEHAPTTEAAAAVSAAFARWKAREPYRPA